MGGHRNQYIREFHNKRGRAWTDYRFKVVVEGGRGWGRGGGGGVWGFGGKKGGGACIPQVQWPLYQRFSFLAKFAGSKGNT